MEIGRLWHRGGPSAEEARAAARLIRKADPASRDRIAADAFQRVAAHATDAADRLAIDMAKAAAASVSDAATKTHVYEAALHQLAAAATPLAGYALALVHCGHRDSQSQTRLPIASAVLDVLAREAPDPHLARQAALLGRQIDACHYWNSSLDGVEATLCGLRGTGDYLGALAAHLVRGDGLSGVALGRAERGWELAAEAARAAHAGAVTDNADDRGAMAKAALTFLADASGGADPTASMAVQAISKMRFRNTSRDAALAALKAGPGGDTRHLAAAGRAMLAKAWAGDDRGRYVDEKSGVAQASVAWIADHATDLTDRGWAELGSAVLAPGKFTTSNEALAAVTFDVLATAPPLDDAHLAQVADSMVAAGVNADAAGGGFQADRSTIVRAMLPFLESHVQSEEAKRILGLWETARENVSFAVSGEGMAHAALQAMVKGRGSDRELAALAGRLVDRAYAGNTSSYAYQDDKTGVALRCAAWLAKEAKDPQVRAMAEAMRAAIDRATFTNTCANVASIFFDAMAKGRPADAPTLARLGRAAMDDAVAAADTSYTYHDDKTVVAYNVLAHIGRVAPDDDTRTASAVLRAAVGSVHFTNSGVAVAKLAFDRLAKGIHGREALADVAARAIRSGIVADGKQDQGPIAAAVFQALSGAETRFAQSSVALDAVRAMMDTGADYRQRTELAARALQAWAAAPADAPLEPFAFVQSLAAATVDAEARYAMLAAAVPVLAEMRNEDATAALKQAAALRDYPSAADSLLDYLKTTAARPTQQQQVEKMAERLNQGPQAGDPKVENADDYVVVAGVRLKKRGAARD